MSTGFAYQKLADEPSRTETSFGQRDKKVFTLSEGNVSQSIVVKPSSIKAFSQSWDEKLLPDHQSNRHGHTCRGTVGSVPGYVINQAAEGKVDTVKCNGRFCMRIDTNWSWTDKNHVNLRRAAVGVGWVFGMITICTFLFLAAPLGLDAEPYKNNYWIYAFVQQFLWTCLVLALFISVYDAALPGLMLRYRLVIHMIGMLTYSGYRLFFHSLNMDANYYVNTFAILVTLIPLSICYLIWVICNVECTENIGLPILDVYTGSFWLEGPSCKGRIYRKPVRQWGLALLYNLLLSSTYTILMLLSLRIQSSTSEISYVSWFFVFCLTNYIVKALIKAVGIILDMGKGGTYSLFFYGEIACLNFYYVFYRSLFDTLDSFWIFLGLQFVHLVHEWAFYPCRSTQRYYDFYQRSVKGAGKMQSAVLDALLSPLSAKLCFTQRDWCSFITLDYSVRVIIQTYTAVWFISGFSFLRYGWNNTHFKYYKNDVSQRQYNEFAFYTSISVLFEVINTLTIDHYFFKPRKLKMLPRLQRLFENNLFGWGVVFLTSAQYTDIWLINTIFKFVY